MSGIKDFNYWMNRYYGNNDYGYRPPVQRNRLSDLAYQQPRNFSYTNADFQQPTTQQQYYQPQQEFYLPNKYEVRPYGGNVKYMDTQTFNDYMGEIDKPQDAYQTMDAYRRLMR